MSTLSSRNDMVDVQAVLVKEVAAIRASEIVSLEDGLSGVFDISSRQTLVVGQDYYLRNGHSVFRRGDELISPLGLRQNGEFEPILILVNHVIHVQGAGVILKHQGNSFAPIDDMDWNIMFVKGEDAVPLFLLWSLFNLLGMFCCMDGVFHDSWIIRLM